MTPTGEAESATGVVHRDRSARALLTDAARVRGRPRSVQGPRSRHTCSRRGRTPPAARTSRALRTEAGVADRLCGDRAPSDLQDLRVSPSFGYLHQSIDSVS